MTEIIGRPELRQRVNRLEEEMLRHPQIDAQTTHALAGGVYARTIHVPAGCVFTGMVHKKDHLNIVHGDVTFINDDGETRLTGYHVIATPAGSKRAAFAHAATNWTTVLRTDFNELSEIESDAVESADQLQSRRLGQNELLKLED